jgi:hypothetical protein
MWVMSNMAIPFGECCGDFTISHVKYASKEKDLVRGLPLLKLVVLDGGVLLGETGLLGVVVLVHAEAHEQEAEERAGGDGDADQDLLAELEQELDDGDEDGGLVHDEFLW